MVITASGHVTVWETFFGTHVWEQMYACSRYNLTRKISELKPC